MRCGRKDRCAARARVRAADALRQQRQAASDDDRGSDRRFRRAPSRTVRRLGTPVPRRPNVSPSRPTSSSWTERTRRTRVPRTQRRPSPAFTDTSAAQAIFFRRSSSGPATTRACSGDTRGRSAVDPRRRRRRDPVLRWRAPIEPIRRLAIASTRYAISADRSPRRRGPRKHVRITIGDRPPVRPVSRTPRLRSSTSRSRGDAVRDQCRRRPGIDKIEHQPGRPPSNVQGSFTAPIGIDRDQRRTSSTSPMPATTSCYPWPSGRRPTGRARLTGSTASRRQPRLRWLGTIAFITSSRSRSRRPSLPQIDPTNAGLRARLRRAYHRLPRSRVSTAQRVRAQRQTRPDGPTSQRHDEQFLFEHVTRRRDRSRSLTAESDPPIEQLLGVADRSHRSRSSLLEASAAKCTGAPANADSFGAPVRDLHGRAHARARARGRRASDGFDRSADRHDASTERHAIFSDRSS